MPTPPYTMESFVQAATTTFQSTTGNSPRIASYYKSLSATFLARKITPSNINALVNGETRALLSSSTPATAQDRIAIAATPFRKVAAHFVAQNLVVGSQGFFDNNEYSKEALSGVVSGTF